MKDFESEGFDLNDLLECRLTFHARIYIRTDNTKSWWITCKCLTLFKASWWNFDFPPAKSTVGPTHLSFSYFNSCLRSCLPSRWGVKTTLMFQIFSIWVFHHCLYACFYSCCFFGCDDLLYSCCQSWWLLPAHCWPCPCDISTVYTLMPKHHKKDMSHYGKQIKDHDHAQYLYHYWFLKPALIDLFEPV